MGYLEVSSKLNDVRDTSSCLPWMLKRLVWSTRVNLTVWLMSRSSADRDPENPRKYVGI